MQATHNNDTPASVGHWKSLKKPSEERENALKSSSLPQNSCLVVPDQEQICLALETRVPSFYKGHYSTGKSKIALRSF